MCAPNVEIEIALRVLKLKMVKNGKSVFFLTECLYFIKVKSVNKTVIH